MLEFPVTAEPDLSPAERLRQVFDLYQFGESIMRQNYLREHPDASEDEVESFILAWLRERPGAEDGDGHGRVCDRSGLGG